MPQCKDDLGCIEQGLLLWESFHFSQVLEQLSAFFELHHQEKLGWGLECLEG